MSKKIYKILSLLVCLCLVFEQGGFAQSIGHLNISGYLTSLHNNIVQDKFRPLHLRYLAYDAFNNNFSLLVDKGSNPSIEEVDLEDSAKSLMNYFFVGLTLPNESFWVNLRPDAETNIIDDELAKTDIGRIMLEADVQLKKDTAHYTSPNTPEGKEYWGKLYKKAGEIFGYDNVQIPTLTRPWIVPDEVLVGETKDGAYIFKATLKVMLEQDYLKDSAIYNFKDERLKVLNDYSSQLIRELIIPKITQEVNSAKRYAPLRQVYFSLILAQWFKAKFYEKEGRCVSLIDRRNLNGLTSKTPWSRSTYFKEYQKSFKDGEYNLKEQVYTPFGQTIRSYFSGGIKLATSSTANNAFPADIIPFKSENVIALNYDGNTARIKANQGFPELPVDHSNVVSSQETIVKVADLPDNRDKDNSKTNKMVSSPIQGQRYSFMNMLKDATDGNPFITTVLSDVGNLAELNSLPDILGNVKHEQQIKGVRGWEVHKEQYPVYILPFDLSKNGRNFFKELFALDNLDIEVSLAMLIIEEQNLALPYALILRDSQNKRIYYCDVLELCYRVPNSFVIKTKFANEAQKSHNKRLFGELHRLLESENPGYEIEGIMLRLHTIRRSSFDSDAPPSERWKLRYEANIISISQPKTEGPPPGIRIDRPYYDDRYDRIIIQDPYDEYHVDFREVLEQYGEWGKFKDKNIGIIGTGQGGDIIEILQHRPRSVTANDKWLLAVIVSRWNVRLARELGVIPSDIPVEIIHNHGLGGLEDSDVIVGNLPAIGPKDHIPLKAGAEADFVMVAASNTFRLDVDYFQEFLKSLALYLGNSEERFALLRLNFSEDLSGEYEGINIYLSVDEIRKTKRKNLAKTRRIYLREAGLEGEYAVWPGADGDSDIWKVKIGKTGSSPLQGSFQTNELGGIDFRGLPIVTRAISNLNSGIGNIPNLDLNAEWQDIKQLVQSGITPSGECIKEYLQVSCSRGKIVQDKKMVIACISDILRQQEEHCISTDPILRDILIVLESNRSMEDFRAIFISVKP